MHGNYRDAILLPEPYVALLFKPLLPNARIKPHNYRTYVT